jgi:DNA repair exonuclease SbcCD ATPase subunit
MATKFQPQTILTYAAAQQMSPQDQQLIPQAIELLKDRPLRNFRIDVAADSLVMLDENQNKQERMEFLQAFGGFLQQALPVAQASPPMVPMMVELMKFGIQAFKQSRPLEGALDQALDQMQQMAAQPNPEAQAAQQAAQVEQQKAQVAMQMEQAKMQASQQVESAKMQLEQAKMTAQAQNDQAKLQMEMQLEQQRQQFEAQMKAQELAQKQEADRYKADLDAATKVMVARISANPGLDIPMFEAQQQVNERVVADLGAEVKSQMDRLAELYAQMAEDNRGAMAQISAALASLSAPKRIVRGQDGRAVGVEPVQLNLQ